MNNLSFSELCCLFCCPPCPGKIASKLAFLPPDPTYTLMCDESGSRWTLHLSERADWQYSSREKDAIECFMTRTSKGNRIACMFVRCSPNAKFTLLFSHGNAVDLGQMSSFYIGLGSRINCNIFSYDYSGYGASSGKPTEKNLYADVEAAWLALRTRYGIRPENVIIYGQSIGTVPSVDLAARYESAAVILHSPLTSGMRVAFPDTKKTYCFDAFPNIDKISKITSPVLIIHGTEDEVIDFSHGLALFERCQRPVEPLWVEGAGHNDVELYGQYLERLKQFVSQELHCVTQNDQETWEDGHPLLCVWEPEVLPSSYDFYHHFFFSFLCPIPTPCTFFVLTAAAHEAAIPEATMDAEAHILYMSTVHSPQVQSTKPGFSKDLFILLLESRELTNDDVGPEEEKAALNH
ncbi:ABHD17B isoform X1 [Sigmodon hispidus]